MSEDPAGIQGGLNLYAFAGNDPVNGRDPYGLCPPENFDITDCGDKPTEYWANVANNGTGATKIGATAAGLFASLWTSDTWYKTAGTLAGGGIVGQFVRTAAAIVSLEHAANNASIGRAWYRSTFESEEASAEYHLGKHGMGRTLEEYTKDAQDFFRQNQSQATEVRLRDGTPGLRIKTPGGEGGYFTPDGRIVTFWYD